MPTEKQRQASRANGARSRGPVTPQGKRNSARNSTRHGLLASTVVLDEEDRSGFLQLVRSFYEEFQPETANEMALIDTMAVARWRLLRIWSAQKISLDRGIALQDPAVGPPCVRVLFALGGSSHSACPFDLLVRYEVALDRQYSRAFSRLLTLRASRPASPEIAATERTREPVEKKESDQPIQPGNPPSDPRLPVSEPAPLLDSTSLLPTPSPNSFRMEQELVQGFSAKGGTRTVL